MTDRYVLKHNLKRARHQARRAAVALRWGPDRLAAMPAVLGNAMPKSGSHLIIQVLHGLTHLGPFVNPGFPPVNRSEDNRKLPVDEIMHNLRAMRPGDIGYGYIAAREPYLSLLSGASSQPQDGISAADNEDVKRATVFVYRDPRDVIVSHVFYATEMHTGHGMHEYYNQQLGSMEERLAAAITGVDQPGAELNSIRAKYDDYLAWLQEPAVLCLRFEDLILQRQAALSRLLDYLAQHGFTPDLPRPDAIAVLEAAIAPRKSGTFRKGKPGNWREHFTPEITQLFKQHTGDLLQRLGYEQDEQW